MRLSHTQAVTPWLAFVEACRLGSLSAAAQQLGYTQSAVSRQILTLERELGVSLLRRNARGVRPTPAGDALLPHARLVVAAAERGRQAAREVRPARHLIVGAVPSTAVSLVPSALREMSEVPKWTMLSGLTHDLVDRIGSGEVDLAVVTDAPPGLPNVPGLATQHLADDPMAVLLPSGHRLAQRRRLDLAALAGELWLEDNPGSEALLHQLAARHALVLDVDRSPSDLWIKTALVAAGYGVALAPKLIGPALRPDVRQIALSHAPRRGIYTVTRPDRPDLEAHIDALRREARR
jgi:DNA-binding transcriptional LysR family regulator